MKRLAAWSSAFRAGWIADRCQSGCVLDHVKEEIVPCKLHAAEIRRLAKINHSGR